MINICAYMLKMMLPHTSVPAIRILLADGVAWLGGALLSPGRTEIKGLEGIK
jgi:hypothetical protein